jgi:uncharacterized membrane protein HdeD (DUF308 family)
MARGRAVENRKAHAQVAGKVGRFRKEDDMTAGDETQHQGVQDELEALSPNMGWKGLAALGVVMLIGGVLAFLNPFAASLAAEAVAGAAFLVAGGVQLWLAVTGRSNTTGDRWLSGALGLALVLFAVSLVLNPLAGLVTLTALVAVFFTVLGALRIGLAWHLRPADGWGWIMVSGVLSLVLAALIVLGLPGAALGILGLFLGIDLTMAGVASLVLAWAKKTGS